MEVGVFFDEDVFPYAYVCELFSNNKGKRTMEQYCIRDDSEEVIASNNASPRQRLFDAIEQNS